MFDNQPKLNMKITVTKTHEVAFQVEAFWAEEGGMGHESFGSEVSTIEEAIVQLELANISNAKNDWIITCNVTTKVSK